MPRLGSSFAGEGISIARRERQGPEPNARSFVHSPALRVEHMRKQLTVASLIGAGLVLTTTAFADPYNPAERALGGGLVGAGTGAVIGAIAGGGRVGAIAGAATTPPRPHHRYYNHHVVHSPY